MRELTAADGTAHELDGPALEMLSLHEHTVFRFVSCQASAGPVTIGASPLVRV